MSINTLLFKSATSAYIGLFENNNSNGRITSFKPLKFDENIIDNDIKSLKLNEFCAVLLDNTAEIMKIYSIGKTQVLDDGECIINLPNDEIFHLANQLLLNFPKTVVH